MWGKRTENYTTERNYVADRRAEHLGSEAERVQWSPLLIKGSRRGTSLAAQWLRLHASTEGGTVVREQRRSCMPRSVKKKKKSKQAGLAGRPASTQL